MRVSSQNSTATLPGLVIAGATLLVAIAAPVFATPPVSWTPQRLQVSVAAGTTAHVQATATLGEDVPSLTAEVVPALGPFVSVEPGVVPSLPAGSQQTFQIDIQIPAATRPRKLGGTLHLREGSSTLAQPLPIEITVTEAPPTVTAKGIELEIPPGWVVDQQSLDLGGPISLNDFDGDYAQGGLRPADGAEIDVTTIPLPNLTIPQLIQKDLAGASVGPIEATQVDGQPGFEVTYSFDLMPSLTEKDLAVYVPHGQVVYKFFLAYWQGNAQEAQLVTTFENLLSSARFTE